jgi:site-specific DNA-methyltransferase (adenine-specific)
MSINKLILGDNLEILKGMEADSIDLVYLDPLFFSNRNYMVVQEKLALLRYYQNYGRIAL